MIVSLRPTPLRQLTIVHWTQLLYMVRYFSSAREIFGSPRTHTFTMTRWIPYFRMQKFGNLERKIWNVLNGPNCMEYPFTPPLLGSKYDDRNAYGYLKCIKNFGRIQAFVTSTEANIVVTLVCFKSLLCDLKSMKHFSKGALVHRALRIWSRETGSAVMSRVSLLILHAILILILTVGCVSGKSGKISRVEAMMLRYGCRRNRDTMYSEMFSSGIIFVLQYRLLEICSVFTPFYILLLLLIHTFSD